MEKVVKKYGGKLLFSSGESNLTSFDFINDEIKFNASEFFFPKSYISNHRIKSQRLESLISNFNKLKILVIGDIIIDEYIESLPIGMSHEDPALVISPQSKEFYWRGRNCSCPWK